MLTVRGLDQGRNTSTSCKQIMCQGAIWQSRSLTSPSKVQDSWHTKLCAALCRHNTTRRKPLPSTRDAWFLKDITPTIALSIVYWVWASLREGRRQSKPAANKLSVAAQEWKSTMRPQWLLQTHSPTHSGFFGDVTECSECRSFLWTAPPRYSNVGIWMVARCVAFVHGVLSSCYSALA